MADEARPNVFTAEWQRTIEEGSFGVEEVIIVLRGTPVLRSPAGPRRRPPADQPRRYRRPLPCPQLEGRRRRDRVPRQRQLGYFEGEPE